MTGQGTLLGSGCGRTLFGEGLPVPLVLDCVKALGAVTMEYGCWSPTREQLQLYMVLERLLSSHVLPVSVAGTGFRLLSLASVDVTRGVAVLPRVEWVQAPDFPAEVVGRFMMELLPGVEGRWVSAAAGRVVGQYPDLAGLPSQQVFEAVAVLPVPEGWLVDVFPLPEYAEWAVPGLTGTRLV